MAWVDLQYDIEEEFSDIRLETGSGLRFFRIADRAAEVARVNEWRKKNRARRNETARKIRARNVDGARAKAREWSAKNREKIRGYRLTRKMREMN